MAPFGNQQLSLFLVLVLVLSPQIQAREGKLFSFFTHFRTKYNVKDSQVLLKEAKAESPAPELAPTPAPTPAPTSGSIIPSGPAPEPEFFDNGNGYGLYGRDSTQYSPPTKETPTTTNFENELLNEDFNDGTYKTGYPKTNFRNNYDNEVYTKSYNSEEYKSTYNNGYNKNYVDSYSNNNNNNNRYSNNYNGNEYYNKNNNRYANNYNGKEYYNNNNYYSNGYGGKREGMSDTRFMEDGKYYHNVNLENENYNLNGYELGKGSTENEGYYEKTQYPNEFDTMEEYEKQQESQGYTP